jgi:cytoskeletal protein RodZ
MSCEIAASLGSSEAEVKRRSGFSVTPTASLHLPRFGLFFVVVLLFAVLVVAVLVVFVVVVRLIVELTVEIKISHRMNHACHETGSVDGLTLSRLGGG